MGGTRSPGPRGSSAPARPDRAHCALAYSGHDCEEGADVPTALDCAAAIIVRQHEAGRRIDKMQLQKLLYLVQGAHMAWFGEKAFNGSFRAYRYGPVERGVERTYSSAAPGSDPLPGPRGGDPTRLPATVSDTVDAILDRFGNWSGPDLERFTKAAGSPWHQARGDRPPDEASSETIRDEAMLPWFGRHGVFPPRELTPQERELLERAAAGDAEALAALL